MPTISRLLVANRGEVALRVLRTARRLGLATVAVFSDADAEAPHVRLADEAVRLGPGPASASYLDAAAVLRAARVSGADAVHPGWGFLAENPDFAQAVLDQGLVFVGPPPAAIRAMGLKREARALAASLGVPLVPGADGGDQTPQTLEAQALALGLPVLIKPSAGGGGKGLHVVRAREGLAPAIAAARREAVAAFGDPTLILERLVERPRHVEVQVLGDAHGHLVHLFERECSLQRRHQKVLEEAPAPSLAPELRAALTDAALRVARAIGYVNAGTVEFLVDEAGRFYFSEMNTRLQVEHRVTEQVLGVDLVELQLRVARGEPLPFTQPELRPRGHAVEVRVCAEDPGREFLPSTGPVLDFHAHPVAGVLVDAGVETGSTVSVHYDSLLAKVVAWADTREEALARLGRALDGLSVLGVATTRAFLSALVREPAVVAGRVHTGLLAERFADGFRPAPSEARRRLCAVAATLAGHQARRAVDARFPSMPTGFRNNRFSEQHADWGPGLRVEYRDLGDGAYLVRTDEGEARWRVVGWEPPCLTFESPEGLRQRARVVLSGERALVHCRLGEEALEEVPRFPPPVDAAVKGGFIAPMPGKVVKVMVRAGDAVTAGQALLVLEAMKMEQTTLSPAAGVVQEVRVREGEQVAAGQVLVVLDGREGERSA